MTNEQKIEYYRQQILKAKAAGNLILAQAYAEQLWNFMNDDQKMAYLKQEMLTARAKGNEIRFDQLAAKLFEIEMETLNEFGGQIC